MLPVHNKPCVQWIVEELSEAGINEIIFVYSKGQEMVKEYFTEKTWYDHQLGNRGHDHHVEHLEKIRNLAQFHFVEQHEQLGDGHAVLQARKLIPENEPFLVFFGDCLYSGENVVGKLQEKYEETNHCILATQEINPEEAHLYGIVTADESGKIETMIEKPSPEFVQTRFIASQSLPQAIIGRYLLSPTIWPHLEQHHAASGEIRLIDALKELQADEAVYEVQLNGTWLDTGTLEGIQKATEYVKNEKH